MGFCIRPAEHKLQRFVLSNKQLFFECWLF